MRLIYLDYNATTPLAPAVQEAMLPFLAEHYGDPASAHVLGRAAHEAMEDARGRVGTLLGVSSDEILFTAGGTESNNLALKGLAFRRPERHRGHIIISALEHPAIVEPVRWLERWGCRLSVVGCDHRGVVDPADVAQAFQPDTFLVSVLHANHEIGTLQPLRAIAELCRERGAYFHTDAAQSVGKVSTMVQELGVDLLSLAGHKLYGPKGVGALYVRRGLTLEPLLHGAMHERGVRAGTQGVAQIVGLGKAAELAAKHTASAAEHLSGHRDTLLKRLREAVPDLVVNGEGATRLPNTLSVNFPRVDASRLLRRIPDLCASTGTSGGDGEHGLSPTQAAIGLTPDTARGTVRLSLGWQTNESDVERAASLLAEAWEALR
jgi:cysteine desulfurase